MLWLVLPLLHASLYAFNKINVSELIRVSVFIPPANKIFFGGGGFIFEPCCSFVWLSVCESVCAIVFGPYLSYGGTLKVPTSHKNSAYDRRVS